mgnify:CR=1 FL=1
MGEISCATISSSSNEAFLNKKMRTQEAEQIHIGGLMAQVPVTKGYVSSSKQFTSCEVSTAGHRVRWEWCW